MKGFNINYYLTGRNPSSEYVEKVIKDFEKRGVDKISMLDRVQAINNFNLKYATIKNLKRNKIIQGRNELSLAMKLYDTMHDKGNWN